MRLLEEEVFVCLDFETTGLDPDKDKIIEAACTQFTFTSIHKKFESLIDPECIIPEESQKIHNITQDMVKGKPTIGQVVPKLLEMMNGFIIVGHGISFDLAILKNTLLSLHYHPLPQFTFIDTLRLARLYGESPVNSLEKLREHFNLEPQDAHRAMSDVLVNIEVFKKLSKPFKQTKELLRRLEKPIRLKVMPLGKHKGRRFDEIPLEYLHWAAKKKFDEDLSYSVRCEINARKKKLSFNQASNPFSSL